MYICIAIITDNIIQNNSRKIAYNLSQRSRIGTLASRLPQHISLKQSFRVDNIVEIEKYFDLFAKQMKSFEVTISKIDLCLMRSKNINTQILWYDVKESTELRELHDKLNRELSDKFSVEKQGYDGDTFKFHSTIAFDTNKEDLFIDSFDILKQKKISFSFKVKKIALFYCPDDEPNPGNFITYKIQNLN